MNRADIHFHHLSWTDPVGRLFWHEGKLCRGIRSERASLYRDLFDRGIIRNLVDKGLVETSVLSWSTLEFPLILEHRLLPNVSFPAEWGGSHLKAAALMLLDLEIELRPHKLTLLDINPWNILFDATRPILVDFSCISPLGKEKSWLSRQQFNDFYLHPLLLFEKGLPRLARRLLCDPWVGVSENEVSKIGLRLPAESKIEKQANARSDGRLSFLKGLLGGKSRHGENLSDDPLNEVRLLCERVSRLLQSDAKTPWAGYYVENFPEFIPSPKWTAKHHSIYSILENIKPQSVIDIGSNRGWYAQLAARQGAHVIAADTDEASINELFADAKAADLPILPVYMDVRFPEPAQGPAYMFFSPATERFKSEMVLALALVHHLVFTWHLNFEQIVRALDAFSKKWLVVEFIGQNDGVVQRWNLDAYGWYTRDNFIEVLSDRYELVSQLPSDAGGLDDEPPDRTIMLCRRRSA